MLIGRSAEQRRLELLLEQARGGRSSALVVRGEAGIGKTALLDETVSRAHGFQILRAVGVESEAEIAFAGLQQLLLPVLGLLSDLPSRQSSALATALALEDGSIPDRLAVWAATLTVLSAAADTRPLLCVIDDAQWLDNASAGTLAFAARRLEVEGIVMLFAAREPDFAIFVAEGVPDLRVDGLPPDAARMLLDLRVPGLAERTAGQLVGVARGNPLALIELPRSLAGNQRLGAALLAEPPQVSVEIERAFFERIRTLSTAARRALLLVAAGDPGDDNALWHALDAGGSTESALAEARVSGLLHAERLDFCHPLARSAVYQLARAADRRGAHATLAAATAESDRRAWHLAAATIGPDAAVAAALEAAGESARKRGGVAAEAKALERAAELTTDVETRSARLLKAALASEAAGWPDHAERLLAEVAALTTNIELRADAVARRTYLVADRGEFGRAYTLALDAAENAPSAKAAHILSLGALMPLTHTLEIRAALDVAERAWRLSGPRAEGNLHVLENLCRTWILAGRRGDARELVRKGLVLVDEPSELAVNLGTDLLYLEDYLRARELLEQVVDRVRDSEAYGFLAYALDQLAKLETRAGSLTRAYSIELESLRVNEAVATDVGLAASLAWLALVEAILGRGECDLHARRALRIAEPIGDAYNVVRARGALGLAALGRGDAVQAVEWLAPAVDKLVEAGVDEPNFFRLDADLIEAFTRLGRDGEAQRHLARLGDQADATHGAWARAVTARCQAFLAPEKELTSAFGEALELHNGDLNGFEHGRTLLCYGERLRRVRRRRDARERLRAALEIFEQVESKPWAERARIELRATGEHVHRSDPTAAQRLTPQEFQVATLVAEGLTNRDVAAKLFLSPKTVEFHLTGVFRKLDVRSRGELIRLFAVQAPQLPGKPANR